VRRSKLKEVEWHCFTEGKSVLAVHQAGRQDPSGAPANSNKPDIWRSLTWLLGKRVKSVGGPIAQCNCAREGAGEGQGSGGTPRERRVRRGTRTRIRGTHANYGSMLPLMPTTESL
jgi:hypothetical protein